MVYLCCPLAVGLSNAQAEVGSRNDGEEEGQGHIHPQTESNEDHRDESIHQQSKLQTLYWKSSHCQGWELSSGIHQAKECVGKEERTILQPQSLLSLQLRHKSARRFSTSGLAQAGFDTNNRTGDDCMPCLPLQR